MIDLTAMQMLENRRKLKVTVLHRPGGVWHEIEVSRLVNGLSTEVRSHPQHPEHLLLYGHYTKEQALAAILGGVAFTATQMTGIEDLPWFPSGWIS